MTEPPKKKSIIVTGASRGLGRAIALAFGRAGGRVVLNYRTNSGDARAVAEEINGSGGEAMPFKADVRIAAQVEAMVADTVNRWGGVDVMVNNAGATRDNLLIRLSEQDWDDVLHTNLKGAFLGIRAVSPTMVRQKSGHIINIASIVGVQGREGQANYAASKAGMIGLTKTCAGELGRFNIKVNAILPGYLRTGMGDKVSRAVIERVISQNALNRVSDAGEVADFVLFLSGMNNVSGQVFNLDSRVL